MKRVLVITNFYPNSSGKEYVGTFVKERVRAISRRGLSSVVVSPKNILKKGLWAPYIHERAIVVFPGYFHIPVERSREKLGWRFFASTVSVVRKLGWHFDVIHAHGLYPAGYGAMLLAQLVNKPLVVTAHGSDLYSFPFSGIWQRKKADEVLSSASAVVVVSKALKDLISENWGQEVAEKTYVITNGVDIHKFFPIDRRIARQKLGLPPNVPILLNVANLVRVKRHDRFLEVVDSLRKYYKDIKAYIVGGGDLRGEIEKMIKSRGLVENVALVGAVPHDKVSLWMNAADVFLLTSENEGMPTVIMEALACGTPVVSFDVGGVREILTGVDGSCVVKDVKSSIEAVRECLNSEIDRNVLRKVAVQFSWDAYSKKIMKVYENVLVMGR